MNNSDILVEITELLKTKLGHLTFKAFHGIDEFVDVYSAVSDPYPRLIGYYKYNECKLYVQLMRHEHIQEFEIPLSDPNFVEAFNKLFID